MRLGLALLGRSWVDPLDREEGLAGTAAAGGVEPSSASRPTAAQGHAPDSVGRGGGGSGGGGVQDVLHSIRPLAVQLALQLDF